MRRIRRGHVLLAAVTAALCVPASGVSSSSDNSIITKVGKTEGQLNLIAWEGYTYKQWVNPFQKATGCRVKSKFGGSSDEMVTLMRTGQYDAVSASGDASLRLIFGKDVRPIDPKLIPDFKNFIPQLKSPPHNTVKGVHYGISLQWGPNTLLYNTKKVKPAPNSWSALYSSKYKGKVTIPDNPIQIADAALYLSKAKPSLGIKDPYELTQPQFNAAVDLLKKQHPLVRKYWLTAGDEIELFKNGDAVIGAAWPYQYSTLIADHEPVQQIIPKEGATGWADTWMLATNAPHPNCAYLWAKWVSTAQVQAEQALSFGETPVNSKACAVMETMEAGSCAKYHADQTSSAYFSTIAFWKTPLATCDDGTNNCVPYAQWVAAWTTIKG